MSKSFRSAQCVSASTHGIFFKYPVTQTENPVLSFFIKRFFDNCIFLKHSVGICELKKLGNMFSLLSNTLKISLQPVLLLHGLREAD